MHRFVAIIGVNLFQDAAHMILHCKLRQIQVCRDLFIAHTPCDKIHQFELPVGQQTFCTTLLAGNLCPLPVFARQILNESHAQFWRAGGLSLCHAPDGGDYFRGWGILLHITTDADACSLLEQTRQRFAKKAVFRYEEYVYARWRGSVAVLYHSAGPHPQIPTAYRAW